MRTDRGLGIARVVIGVHSLNYARHMQGIPWHVPLQMQGKPLHSPQNRGFEEDSIHDIYYIMNFRNRAGRMPGTIHSGSHVQLTGIPPQTHAISRVSVRA